MNVFNATARIRADKEDKKIRIDVYGVEEAAMRNKSPVKAFHIPIKIFIIFML
jgi:hypothetical protein